MTMTYTDCSKCSNPVPPTPHITRQCDACKAGRAYVTRQCLKCDRAFKSQGKHNRLCDPCRNANAQTFDTDAVVKRYHQTRKLPQLGAE